MPELQVFTVFVRDDSARVAAERAVVEQAEHLERLLDSTVEGIYGVDLQGRCTFVNRAALHMLGYAGPGQETALLGSHVRDAIHHQPVGRQTDPESASRTSSAVRPSQTPTALYVDHEVFRRRDGTSFPVAYWSNPIVKDGEVRGAITTFLDISQRLRERAQLDDSNLRLEQTFELAPVGMTHLSVDGRILRANKALGLMLGRVPAELVGLGHRELSAPEDWAAIEGSLHAALSTPQAPVSVEVLFRRPDATQVWGSVSTAAVLSSDGEPTHLVSVVKDITDAKRFAAERESYNAARLAHQTRTEFLSRMSHELRTPLSTLRENTVVLNQTMSRDPFNPQARMTSGKGVSRAGRFRAQGSTDPLDHPELGSPEDIAADLHAAIAEALRRMHGSF